MIELLSLMVYPDLLARQAALPEVYAEAVVAHTDVDDLDLSPLHLEVRRCESNHDYTAQNPMSSASGAWQFIDSTWEWVTGLPAPASDHPPHVQDRAFLELWDDGAGAGHWAPSRHCWAGAS